MDLERPTRAMRGAAVLATAATLLAMPATATVNIPEGGAVARDSVSVITLRVLDGCDGEATDRLEIEIPEAVRNVVPASVPGWTVEVETSGGDDATTTTSAEEDASIRLVRWSGGPLPAGQYLDFGMRAYFPDEPGTSLAFPVTQGCGLTEVRWDGDRDSDNPAPLVAIGDHVGQRELGELQDTVEAMAQELGRLAEQLEGVDPSNLQNQVTDVAARVDERLPEMVERMNRLADRIGALEDAATAGAEDGGAESTG